MGFNYDLSIKVLAEIIQEITGHKGGIHWDSSKPDGAPRKQMDSSKPQKLGWHPKIALETGIHKTYAWFLDNQTSHRKNNIN